ncbi:alpha/beta fold hydrolase [Isosphaeraceae bacterium EP7]
MLEPSSETWTASDGYPIHVTTWHPEGSVRGACVVLHGVQSHGGWYHRMGRNLASRGYVAYFPDRRGSGANRQDRGHTPSSRRLVDDVGEFTAFVRGKSDVPLALAGISWGGKLAVVAAGLWPDRIDALALICPGLRPRVGVSFVEKLRIAVAFATNRRKTFPIPLADPALFTAEPAGQAFIAADSLSLRVATAGLLAASTFLDLKVRKIPAKVTQPILLMLGGQDRIVDNIQTRAYFDQLASADRKVIEYPEAHHTLEFEPDPDRYMTDLIDWLDSVLEVRPRPLSR